MIILWGFSGVFQHSITHCSMAISFQHNRSLKNSHELCIDTSSNVPQKRHRTTPYPGQLQPAIYSSPSPVRGRSLKRAKQLDDLELPNRPFSDQRLTALQLSKAWDSITKQVNWFQVAAEVNGDLSEQYQEGFRNLVYDGVERAIESERHKFQPRPVPRALQTQKNNFARIPLSNTSKLEYTAVNPSDSPDDTECVEIESSSDEDSDTDLDEDLGGDRDRQARIEIKAEDNDDQVYQPSTVYFNRLRSESRSGI